MRDSNPHTYGAGTDLSSLYTIGRNGQPCPKWAGARDSAGRKAWAQGRKEYTEARVAAKHPTRPE